MGENRRRWRASFAAFALVGLALGGAAAPAGAATAGSWADWDPLAGTGGNYTTGFALAGAPAITAEATTDSRAGQVGVISGASTWLSEGTPVGQKYGSSKNRPYLNLRPKADTVVAPSTTTYTFAKPTPTANWTFVIGDIDADQLQVRAVGPDGVALTAAQLGFRGGFNYCAPGVAGKPSCTGDATDVPVWNAQATTLIGNAAASDTNGSSAWFEPTAPISSLSFTFTRRSGFPVYQTWFASLTRDVSGTVTAQTGNGSGVQVALTDPNGDVVATVTTGPGGTYSFPGIQASDGYTVTAQPPLGQIVDGPASKPANLSNTDAVVDFAVRDIVPVAVSGTVKDANGKPIPGATVTIPGVGSVTTAPNGSYLFDTVPVGTHQPQLTAPKGYHLTTGAPSFTIPPGSEVPITGEDFIVSALPSLSGTVTTAGTGTAGVTVTATGPSGTVRTVTGADGAYSFPGLVDGAYTVAVTAPAGTVADGPVSRNETVAGSNLTGVDFAFARLGSITGATTADGKPLPNVMLHVQGPGFDDSFSSGEEGVYDLGALPAGTYTITATAPKGYRIVGSPTRTVIITAAGEAVIDQDFVFAAVTTPPTTTPPTSTAPTAPPAHPGSGALADTGTESAAIGMIVAAAAALLLGGSLLLLVRRRRTR
ncbi:carboxypeptidase regulatory-like domain-containing protein [Leucobacter iarius]|uniref:alpha-amylase n=1 Tax=Leucobacter iarius TaxID=333963 RepID=A0ABP4Y1A9_9MICO